MNARAVVLATDTLVTSNTSILGHRTHDEQCKIFDLGFPRHCIAVALYGATSVGLVGWVTLLERFSKSLSVEQLGSVSEYAEAFCDFVRTHPLLSPQEVRDDLRQARLTAIVEDRMQEARDIRLDHELSGEKLVTRLRAAVKKLLGELSFRPYLTDLEEQSVNEKRDKNYREYHEIADKVASKYGIELTRSDLQDLLNLLAEVSCRQVDIADAAGFVFAGFGKDELLPSAVPLKYFGVDDDREFSFVVSDADCVTSNDPGVIREFSEPEDFEVFFGAIGQDNIDPVRQAWLLAVDRLGAKVSTLTSSWGGSVRPQIVGHVIRQWAEEEALKSLPRPRRSMHDVVDAVSVKSPRELAQVAEDCVRLTRLGQQVTPSKPVTVGGDVDIVLVESDAIQKWRSQRLSSPVSGR